MRCPDISELPAPPPSKKGWPWTLGDQNMPNRILEKGDWPSISIVTPSFNQAEYLEETIRSVLLQGYTNLEYFIMDGGSTDKSKEIINRYNPWITGWVSEKDQGQSHAINKGFRRASGEWLGWLNSDDCLAPQGLFRLLYSAQASDTNFVFGSSVQFDPEGSSLPLPLRRSPELMAFSPQQIRIVDLIEQPASLWTRELFDRCGLLREDMHYAFDWEFYIRASNIARPALCPDVVAAYRFHTGHKTGFGGQVRLNEIIRVYLDYLPSEYRERFVRALPVISLLSAFSLSAQNRNRWLRYFNRVTLYLINKSGLLSLFGFPDGIWVMLSIARAYGRFRDVDLTNARFEYGKKPISNVDEALAQFPPSPI